MMKKYDAIYIFVNAPKDEGLDKLVEKVGAEITRLGGELVGSEMLGKRNFARPMHKRDNGVYVKIRFELDPAQVAALVGRYHLVEDVFRVQILAVDERREAVLVKQAALQKAREAARAAAAEKEAANANQETQEA